MGVLRRAVAASALVVTSFVAAEPDASACGGCFAPPEDPTVVSDHRMILSISKRQSTLYDQIRYAGSPASFAWVLPISGTVAIGISSDAIFEAVDAMTRTVLFAPPSGCPSAPTGCGFVSDAGVARGAQEDDESVRVVRREVVGPYETVQLRASEPGALQAWLDRNGFAVPPDVQPVVGRYVEEKFDFLALKLAPGKGVSDMRPVRVTTVGASAVLPLRMVAAGAGPVVGISLWVIGEGRYEPESFPSFVITADELTWDWAASRTNYAELRAQKTAAAAGGAFEIESSTTLARAVFEANVRGRDAAREYLPVTDADGRVVRTAAEAREDDLASLFAAIATTAPRVTRMRADLTRAALERDLAMVAAPSQEILPAARQVMKEAGQPACPVWNGCDGAGTRPRDEAVALSKDNWGAPKSDGTFTCATALDGGSSWTWAHAGFGLVALAAIRGLRERRRRPRR